jgi:hypothetical protein
MIRTLSAIAILVASMAAATGAAESAPTLPQAIRRLADGESVLGELLGKIANAIYLDE